MRGRAGGQAGSGRVSKLRVETGFQGRVRRSALQGAACRAAQSRATARRPAGGAQAVWQRLASGSRCGRQQMWVQQTHLRATDLAE